MTKQRSTKPVRRLRAIDLYSGVGGWSFGLRLADIDVVASYDRSGPANETNFKNNHHQAQTVDIRRLDLTDLPRNIDVVVGIGDKPPDPCLRLGPVRSKTFQDMLIQPLQPLLGLHTMNGKQQQNYHTTIFRSSTGENTKYRNLILTKKSQTIL